MCHLNHLNSTVMICLCIQISIIQVFYLTTAFSNYLSGYHYVHELKLAGQQITKRSQINIFLFYFSKRSHALIPHSQYLIEIQKHFFSRGERKNINPIIWTPDLAEVLSTRKPNLCFLPEYSNQSKQSLSTTSKPWTNNKGHNDRCVYRSRHLMFTCTYLP